MQISFKTLLLSLLIAQMTACSSDDLAPADTPVAENIQWEVCAEVASFECASLSVPMDYSEPDGEQIDIALTRLPASVTNTKGSLVLNFGGFGAEGVKVLQEIALEGLIPEAISDVYDLVAFDPRGVGGSTIVDCSEQGAGEENPYPASADQITELFTDSEQVAIDCAAQVGHYLQHLGSINVVRDMDLIRVALGEEALNFFGASAGTRSAALYLQEFPESSGRVVLDASLPPESSIADLFVSGLPAQEQTLRNGLSLCSEDFPDCDAQMLSSQLGDRANALALEGSDSSRLELQLIDLVIGESQESPEFWMFAAEPVISYINTLDVTVLLDFISLFIEFEDPAELFEGEDPGIIVEKAIVCADDAARPDVASLISTFDEFNQLSNYFAESALAQVAYCAGWPEALEPLAPLVTNTAPQSLVIGGTSDSLTLPEWSEDMATQIGGVFVSSEHDGHTAVFLDKSPCLDTIVAEFFLEGTIPVLDGPVSATDECDGN
ncbi:MAG: alpha/beta fold hydrolase [Granulosicoccus sp.]